jgi:hypothetical protein
LLVARDAFVAAGGRSPACSAKVLALCADAGLARVGVIAIDGTKLAANANRDRMMTSEQISRAMVEEAIETDAAETARHGELRGDERERQPRARWLGIHSDAGDPDLRAFLGPSAARPSGEMWWAARRPRLRPDCG